MSVFPPAPVPGQEYPIRVPMVDGDGNSLAGLRYPDVEVPLGTYNGWSLRKTGYAEGEQFWNTGSFVPFARTRAEREANGDPRPSIEERYPSHEAYVDAIRRACERLRQERLMLQEDADRFVEAARSRNPLDPSVPLGPLIRVLTAPGWRVAPATTGSRAHQPTVRSTSCCSPARCTARWRWRSGWKRRRRRWRRGAAHRPKQPSGRETCTGGVTTTGAGDSRIPASGHRGDSRRRGTSLVVPLGLHGRRQPKRAGANAPWPVARRRAAYTRGGSAAPLR